MVYSEFVTPQGNDSTLVIVKGIILAFKVMKKKSGQVYSALKLAGNVPPCVYTRGKGPKLSLGPTRLHYLVYSAIQFTPAVSNSQN